MNKFILSLVLGTICIGFAPIFVQYSDLAAAQVGFYRTGIGGLILFIYLLIKKQTIPREKKFFFITHLAGFIFAWDLFFWHQSIKLIGAGLATILANTQIFYLLILGLLFYQEKISFKKIIIFIFAFLGLYLILNEHKSFHLSENFIKGVFLALSTGLTYACYTTTMKKLTLLKSSPNIILIVCFVSLFTSLWMGVFSLFSTERIMFHMADLPALFGLAIICQIGGWMLISFGLKHTPLSISGLIILLQPLVAKILSIILFQEPFSTIEFAGATILFISLYFGSQLRRD